MIVYFIEDLALNDPVLEGPNMAYLNHDCLNMNEYSLNMENRCVCLDVCLCVTCVCVSLNLVTYVFFI